MEIDIEAQNKEKLMADGDKNTKSDDISLSIEDNQKTPEIKKEFDWFMIDQDNAI